MTEKEIERVISKLREKYGEHSKKHSPKWFNLDAFNERLEMAVRNRMNLEAFVLAEIANFEKTREKYEKSGSRKSFSEKVDRIIEENTARIRKYPEIGFHPSAMYEITHLYGAMAELSLHFMPVFSLLELAEDKKSELRELSDRLDFLATPVKSRHPKRIQDHILVLSRNNAREIEIEADRNDYLKECGFLLHDLVKFCDKLIESRSAGLETPLLFKGLFVEDKRKKKIIGTFTGLTGYGAVFRVKEYCSGLVGDFRLGAFRRKKQ